MHTFLPQDRVTAPLSGRLEIKPVDPVAEHLHGRRRTRGIGVAQRPGGLSVLGGLLQGGLHRHQYASWDRKMAGIVRATTFRSPPSVQFVT